jgi:hypothetical protein
MGTPSLRSVFVVKEDIDHQHWTSSGKRYNVGALYDFARAVSEPEEIPLDSLKRGFEKTEVDEEKWSDEFVDRCQDADLSYPILVVQDSKGRLWIADGNHRYGKAVMQAQEFIPGYIVQEKDLPEKAIEPAPDDKKVSKNAHISSSVD